MLELLYSPIVSAIGNAAKVAYLSRLLENGINEIRHYTPDDIGMLASQALQLPMPTKLNKLKKTHPEAFFYLNEIQRIGECGSEPCFNDGASPCVGERAPVAIGTIIQGGRGWKLCTFSPFF